MEEEITQNRIARVEWYVIRFVGLALGKAPFFPKAFFNVILPVVGTSNIHIVVKIWIVAEIWTFPGKAETKRDRAENR